MVEVSTIYFRDIDIRPTRGEAPLLNRLPIFQGKTIDLYALYAAVTSRGGLEITCRTQQMMHVSKHMGASETDYEAPCSLREFYRHFLLPFEQQAMFNIHIPPDIYFVRKLYGESSSSSTGKRKSADEDPVDYHMSKHMKRVKVAPSRSYDLDGDGEKGSFRGVIVALESADVEDNVWALNTLLRVSAIQESGADLQNRSVPRYGIHSREKGLSTFSFLRIPRIFELLVQPPYLATLCREVLAGGEEKQRNRKKTSGSGQNGDASTTATATTTATSVGAEDDAFESAMPLLDRRSISQILILQILKIIQNYTYDVQSQKMVSKRVPFLSLLFGLLEAKQACLVDAALGVLSNIAHLVALNATVYETHRCRRRASSRAAKDDVGEEKMKKKSAVPPLFVTTPLAAIVPANGLVPSNDSTTVRRAGERIIGSTATSARWKNGRRVRDDEMARRFQCLLDHLVPRILALLHSPCRTRVLRATVCLAGFARQPQNAEIVSALMSRKTANRLVALLGVSIQRGDATKTSTFANRNRRGGTEQRCLHTHVDLELRDAALQAIYYVADESEDLRRIFCAEPRCIRRILHACRERTYNGSSAAVAGSLVALLSTLPTNLLLHFGKDEETSLLKIAVADDSSLSRTALAILLDWYDAGGPSG
eukprot:g5106.t1